MLVDARSVPSGTIIDADVCIVGAGPAGLTIVREFDRAGIGVVMLESGGQEPEREAQELADGDSVGYSYHRLQHSRARAIGGTSTHWPLLTSGGDEGWLARPLDPVDFEARPDITGSGWPFDRAELDRYYPRASEVAGLGSHSMELATWVQEGVGPLPLGPEIETRIFRRGTQNFARYRNLAAASANITLLYHATVAELVAAEAGQTIDRARVVVGPDREMGVAARLFVLAAGGIDNPRLLLLSNRRYTAGIGNDHDLVGRYFMEKLTSRAGTIQPRPGLIDRLGLYESHLVNGLRIQAVVSLSRETLLREGLLNAEFWLHRSNPAFAADGVASALTLARGLRRQPFPEGGVRHVRNVVADLDDVGRVLLYRAGLSRPRKALIAVGVQAEQTPNPASRVTLSDRVDRFGLRLPRLDWRISSLDRESIRRSEQILDRALQATGLGRFRRFIGDEQPPVLLLGNFHHIGTTRMDADPRKGVVDASGRVHGIENLFVAGSSVFPTSGSANPTLTIVALALRLADTLRKRLEPDAVPLRTAGRKTVEASVDAGT